MWYLLCKIKLFAKVSPVNFPFLTICAKTFSIVSPKLFICKSLVFTRISNFFVPHMFTVAKIPSFVQLNNKHLKNPWLRQLLLSLIQYFLIFVVSPFGQYTCLFH